MDKDIIELLEKSIVDTKIDLIQPDKELLEVVLSLQGNNINALSEQQLSSYIFVLSQYQHFLQVQANYKDIRYSNAKRDYEFSLAKAVSAIEGKTVKGKELKALISSENLQYLEKQLRLREADSMLFSKVPETLSEMANALKKELGLRGPMLGGNKYGYSR